MTWLRKAPEKELLGKNMSDSFQIFVGHDEAQRAPSHEEITRRMRAAHRPEADKNTDNKIGQDTSQNNLWTICFHDVNPLHSTLQNLQLQSASDDLPFDKLAAEDGKSPTNQRRKPVT